MSCQDCIWLTVKNECCHPFVKTDDGDPVRLEDDEMQQGCEYEEHPKEVETDQR